MKKIIMVLFVAVIVLGVFFIPSFLASRNTTDITAQPITTTIFSVRTEYAETRTLEAYLEVNANIVSGHQVAVMPDAAGRLVSMRVGIGSIVQRGTLIAQVDPSRPGSEFALSPVNAPVSGMVITTPPPVGSTVNTGTILFNIAVDSFIEIEALIPEREVGQLRTGLKADIRLEAFPGEIFVATLTQVSPIIDPVSRAMKVTMRFDRSDPRIIPGMFARVRLNTRTYQNVVSIPQEALVEHRGKTVVYVLNNETSHVEMREVSTGVTVNREVEIRNGLASGEAVVVQGQQFLTDGAIVRVIGRSL